MTKDREVQWNYPTPGPVPALSPGIVLRRNCIHNAAPDYMPCSHLRSAFTPSRAISHPLPPPRGSIPPVPDPGTSNRCGAFWVFPYTQKGPPPIRLVEASEIEQVLYISGLPLVS
ncbi:hypothetical protein BGX38DRAFT_1208114, partial [Terfezia claveryi]